MRVLLDTHVLLWALGSRAGWMRRRAARSKAATPRCCSAPPAFGRSPSNPDLAGPGLFSTQPRSPERRSTRGLANWPFARTRPPSSAACRCCTGIRSTAFSWLRRSSSLQPSTPLISNLWAIRTWSNGSKPGSRAAASPHRRACQGALGVLGPRHGEGARGELTRKGVETDPLPLPLVGERAGAYRRTRWCEVGKSDARRCTG